MNINNNDMQLNTHEVLTFYKYSKLQQSLNYILYILSFGLFYLLQTWINNLKILQLKKSKSLAETTVVKITNLKTKKSTLSDFKRESVQITPNDQPQFTYFFVYEQQIYYYKDGCFQLLHNQFLEEIEKNQDNINKMIKIGLGSEQIKSLSKLYGPNLIDIPLTPIYILLMDQLFSPFYLYQVACTILWNLNDYATYGDALFVIATISCLYSVYQIRTQDKKVRQMAITKQNVQVYRKQGQQQNIQQQIDSTQIVIGDIIMIEPDTIMSSDILLLEGQVIVNEAILTGESVPVVKNKATIDMKIHQNNIILSGTRCLKSYNDQKNKYAVGIVINTGFRTTKGILIKQMLKEEIQDFPFFTESLYFLAGIMVITTIGFLYYLLFIGSEYLTTKDTILNACEIFATAVPPTLPLCLLIGIEFSVERLQKKGIYTVKMQKIMEAGRVNIMCFDKTGTLTENSLSFKSVVVNTKNQQNTEEDELSDEIDDFSIHNFAINKNLRDIYKIMATCHSLSIIENNEIVGDPLEIEMFARTNCQLVSNVNGFDIFIPDNIIYQFGYNENQGKLKVIKVREFTPERKRQSCIVKNTYNDQIEVYLKGSPELVKQLCKIESLPNNYDQRLEQHSKEGFRILALASKTIQKEQINEKTEWIENELNFKGFLLMKNKLKDQTIHVLSNLELHGIKNIMITGDNLNTAVSVAQKCGIISQTQILTEDNIQDIIDNYNDKNININIDNDNNTIISNDKEEEKYITDDLIQYKYNMTIEQAEIDLLQNKKQVYYGIEGDLFEKIYKKYKEELVSLDYILQNTLVYARTNPKQKAMIVNAYKKMQKRQNQNFLVGFCGDGANDCPALKKANIGLSLSQQEASIAAPFTSNCQDISSVQELLIEGKACMQTGITNFEYVCCSSVFTFFCLIVIYYVNLNYTNGQYYTSDIFLDMPLSIIMCSTGSAKYMTSRYPSSTLLNRRFLSRTIFSVLSVFLGFILLVFTISLFPEYLPANMTGIYLGNENLSRYTFFMLSYVCYIFNSFILIFFAIIVNKGKPFRKSWYKNKLFLYFVLGYSTLLIGSIFLDITNLSWLNWFRNYMYGVLNYPLRNPIIGILMSILFAVILYSGHDFINRKFRYVN